MKKISKIVTLFFFLVLGLGISSIAEEITLTTYYPAPYGEYEELRAKKSAIGSLATMPTDDGDLNVAGDLTVEGNVDFSTPDGVWLEEGDLYLGSPTESGHVFFKAEERDSSTCAADIRVGSQTVAGGSAYPGLIIKTYNRADSGDIEINSRQGTGVIQVYAASFTVSGKATFTGGVDPPYISFSSESHETIREYAKEVEEHEKVMQFWNGEAQRIEIYIIAEDKFYTLAGKLIK